MAGPKNNALQPANGKRKYQDLSASTILVDKETDLHRWRLRNVQGTQTWHYLKTDEEVKAWPQTLADRHYLGLPLVWHHALFLPRPG